MDKLIKTISESGSFRAYVLDSTETVRTAQEKHNTLSSSTVALGRTLIANQILAANQKGDSKITVKVIGNGSFGHIISVADTASVAISELVLFSSAIFFADSAATVIATPKINITIVLTIFLLKLNFIFYILV